MLILILYNIQKGSLNNPPVRSSSGLFIEDFTSTEAVNNIAKIYADKTGTVAFNNVKITGNLDVSGIANCLPPGTIVAYNGMTAPPGWAICDGSNNTPDLRGRFIRMWYQRTGTSVWGDMIDVHMPNAANDGAGSSEKIKSSALGDNSSYKTAMMNHWFGDRGGSDWRGLNVNEMPRHSHPIGVANSTNEGCAGPGPGRHGNGVNNMRNDAGTYGYGAGSGITTGCHGGRIEPLSQTDWDGFSFIGATGSNYGVGIQPPYYVLTYIMKL